MSYGVSLCLVYECVSGDRFLDTPKCVEEPVPTDTLIHKTKGILPTVMKGSKLIWIQIRRLHSQKARFSVHW